MLTHSDSQPQTVALEIDLSDLEIEDVEVLVQDGAKGMHDFAASTAQGDCTAEGASSCTVEEGFA